MNVTTKFWSCWNDIIDCSDDVVIPATDAGNPITTTSRDVEAKPSVDYG